MITFEKIRDVFRLEKNSPKLQRLPDDFLQEIGEYLRKKEQITDKTTFDTNEFDNIKDTINRLIEIRKKKVMNTALIPADAVLNIETMLKEEEEFFTMIRQSLESFDKRISESMNKIHEIRNDGTSSAPGSKLANDAGNSSGRDVHPRQPAVEHKDEYQAVMDLPEIVGPDMKLYSFKSGDIITEGSMPKPLNDLLMKKGFIIRRV